MNINLGFLILKTLRSFNLHASRDCHIDKTSQIGYGSNCIRLNMGKYSYIGHENSISDTIIGSYCSIASYCAIGGGVHAMDLLSMSPIFNKNNRVFRKSLASANIDDVLCEPVIIGNDVWIGEAVFIKAGVTIGDGAIVGAHSVVTHNVPPYAIVAGCPSRIIRYRFDKDIIDYLMMLKWWNLSEDIIKLRKNIFEKRNFNLDDLKKVFDPYLK